MSVKTVSKLIVSDTTGNSAGSLVFDDDDELFVVLADGELLPIRNSNGQIVTREMLKRSKGTDITRGVTLPIEPAGIAVESYEVSSW